MRSDDRLERTLKRTPRMRPMFVEVSRIIAAPSEVVWELITDTRRWREWGPSVVDVRCSDRFIKQGSSGQVKTIIGIWLPFTIADYEHDKRWSWIVAGIQATGHRIESIGAAHCRLTFEVPWFALPYLFVCMLAESRIAKILRKQGDKRGSNEKSQTSDGAEIGHVNLEN